MTHLACAVSLGLLMPVAPLGLSAAIQSYAEASLSATTRVEDDRGSGRLSRVPAIANQLSFRGSGRVDPTPPTSATTHPVQLAYRGSGRIVEPGTTSA
ncbi:hypothetical protein C7293_07480 [filamentous cyanobacterium CCT1]|nr:hypothetical protein C7293_07480 [filamentous cyanobacterium CCT1]PSN78237.1 hypothetical protein C8B47_17955 [filamentous cyanobacterium CCP4]